MNAINRYKIGILCIVMFCVQYLDAQVTIGLDKEPAKAAILDIKTKEPGNPTLVTDDSNITSDKGGLILPRVKLVDKTKLSPFLTDAQATQSVKVKHAGLSVYNIYESPTSVTDANKIFHQGVYMWDGTRWSQLHQQEHRFFHMPSFTLDIRQVGTKTIDLYAEYVKQYTHVGVPSDYPSLACNPGATIKTVPVFQREELDYYITYYEKSLISNVSINDKGIMTYTVNPVPDMEPYSYLNIVFAVK